MSPGGSAESWRREEVLAALRDRRGGGELLALARTHEDLALVGGATRDLLLGRGPRELDVVVAGDAAALARELAGSAGEGAEVTVHERFGTAAVEWDGVRVDIAARRAESYPAPGALPDVRPGTLEEDLRRRDFTVNAIAAPLGEGHGGELLAPEGALADLGEGCLRVLHDASFIDDPTRLLRLARYGSRLGFRPDAHTAALAAAALAQGALASVSGARVGAELRLALDEDDPVAALAELDSLGVLAALDPPLRFDASLARRSLALLPADARPQVLLLSIMLLHPGSPPAISATAASLLDALEFNASERDRAIGAAALAPELPARLRAAARPSDVCAAVGRGSPEAVALAAALAGGDDGDPAVQAAREWIGNLRHVRLTITGEDLLDAGVPAGPEIGRGLELALARKLDGELADGREAELRAALGSQP